MATFRQNPFLMKDKQAGAVDSRGVSVMIANDQMDELRDKFVKVTVN